MPIACDETKKNVKFLFNAQQNEKEEDKFHEEVVIYIVPFVPSSHRISYFSQLVL